MHPAPPPQPRIRLPRPSPYLLAMPRKVLFAEAGVIEAWCKERGKARPTLLDLYAAREYVKAERAAR